jgi:hypothetical protein
MQIEVRSATERVIAMRELLDALSEHELSAREVEDALSEGYAQALDADAWLTRTEQRLHELIDDASIPFRGRELRELARDHAAFQREVIELRGELERLRRQHERRIRSLPSASRSL